ncbi:hypothetical protein DL770_000185 [Monosporascus sp. CRB-9-2]|nr:hypothetical protein DL770_000185 [Monosporascus sp. CRB-9-2]
MAQLHDLPPEVIVSICHRSGSAYELANLSATCRGLYNVVNRQMYLFDAREPRKIGPNALHWAAFKGDLASAKKALDAGANPDRNWSSYVPRVRIRSIADAQLSEKTGRDLYWTAMHLAVAYGNEKMIQLLLNYHASINTFSIGFCCCQYGPRFTDTDRVMGQDPYYTPSVERWPLLHTAFCFGHDRIANSLARREAAIYKLTRRVLAGDTGTCCLPLRSPTPVLNMAAFYGCHKTLDYLLKRDPNLQINQPDRCGRTILNYAAMGEAPEKTVPLLVKAGAHVNPRGPAGPLLFEVCWGDRFVAALKLLEYGANVEGIQVFPHTTLLGACCLRTIRRGRLPETYSCPLELHLLSRTMYHDPLAPWRSWPINRAERNSKFRYDAVQLLLDRGVDVNERFGDATFGEDGRTALFSAAEGGLHDIVELLLSHGADITVRDASYNTVLTAAINDRNTQPLLETVQILLKHGVDVNAQNSAGDTALRLLRKSNYAYEEKRMIAKLLLENGAYPLENVAASSDLNKGDTQYTNTSSG